MVLEKKKTISKAQKTYDFISIKIANETYEEIAFYINGSGFYIII